MGASDWMFGLILYFVGLLIIVSLFSISGVFAGDNQVVVDSRFSSSLQGNINTSKTADDLTIYPNRSYFADIFSFFYWNISIYGNDNILVQYLWLIRIIFVYIPFLALLLTIYYSLPTVSG